MATPMEIFSRLPADILNVTLEQAREVVAEDCVIHEAANLPGIGRDWVGPEGFVGLMRAIAATYPNFAPALDALLTNDTDALVVKARISADLPAGRFDIPLLEYWTFRDGKAVDILPVWHDAKLVHDLWAASQPAPLTIAS